MLVGVCSTILLAACYDTSEYFGDGHFTDKGISSATDRYVLSLGEVNLSAIGTKVFKIAGLPETEFVVGIEIDDRSDDQDAIDQRAIDALVSLELSHASGQVIFRRQARLADWTWSIGVGESKAFLYQSGRAGSYFRPLRQDQYNLKLTVHQADSSRAEYTAVLMAKSGGWK